MSALFDLSSYEREYDVLVVWKFDRLGRSMSHLIESVNNPKCWGIGLR